MNNIPENEKREDNKPKTNSGLECHERSVIIIGSKGVGKTTMVYRFLRKEDTPKPTIAMDYSFGRKAGTSFIKDTFHVWEVGHLASSLISAAMTGSTLCHSPHQLTILLMVDLSKPDTLWNILEESISALRSALKMSYNDQTIEEIRQSKLRDWQKLDRSSTDIFPFRMCIIGGRYDEFKEFDFEKKELIGKTLRGVAHLLGSGLHYHSSKDTVLVRKTKDLLSHYGFDAQLSKTVCFDYNKPLIIPAGSDTWTSIDINFGNNILPSTLDSLKQIFISQIHQGSKEEEIQLEDPANDPNFNEAIIDRLRTQREEEISILLRDMLEGRTAKIFIPDPS